MLKGGKKKLWLFRGIAILLPFLLLLLLEGVLRVFHYGYNTNLFVSYPADKDYWVLNPAASKRYFTDPLNATTGNREPFRKEKEAGTIRIFVLGESTTIGYPYFHNGSFHRWLLYRLAHNFPDKKFEIVNIALTAVNSYTVLGFAREVVNYKPDAVLIYSGHNEYYGALGVGSTNRLGGSRWLTGVLLWLRQFREIQLMTNMERRIAGFFSSGASRTGKTRMELMVGEQQIPYGSSLYKRGIGQFRENMEATVALFNDRHIPVFLSNLVSNERDQPPFISFPADKDQAPRFRDLYEKGLQALRGGDSRVATSYFLGAEGIDSTHALCNYYLGRGMEGMGDYAGAKKYYEKAREYDALPFRAPQAMNDIIGSLCRKYNNTHLVDTRSAFDTASGHGIIGYSLLLEHVHPNLAGYALLSDVFYAAMKKEGIFSPAAGREMSFAQLLMDMPVTVVDSLAGAYKIGHLKKSWPFNGSAGPGGGGLPSRADLHVGSAEGELAYNMASEGLPWEEAMRQLFEYYNEKSEWEKAARVMESLSLEHPLESVVAEKTGKLYGKLQEYEKAIFYFDLAFQREPGFERAHYLFVLNLQLDRPIAAMPYLDYAIAHNTSRMNLQSVKELTQEIIDLERQLVNDSTNETLLKRVAGIYHQMGNKTGASIYEDKVRRMGEH